MSNNQKHYPLNGKEWIEKSNSLNELRPNTLKLQEYRFFCIYLAKINARNEDSRIVRFPVDEFQQIMELGRVNITHMKETTDKLLSQIVHIPREDGGYDSFQLFKKCVVGRDNFGRWYVEINAHDEALPLMFNFKEKYFKYRLENVLTLKSLNQIRLYELLKAREHIGGTLDISIDILKQKLGIGKKQYPRWNNFKARVIEPCREALQGNTDICFTYVPIKEGNRIVGIRFTVYIMPEVIPEVTKITYQSETAVYYAQALGEEFTEEAVLSVAQFAADNLTGHHELDNPCNISRKERIYKYLSDGYERLCNNRCNNRVDHPIAYLKKLIKLDFDGEFDSK
jgi:plasmid replication initiation protein